MKLLFDFFPILLFFIAYKIYGIYIATAVAMAASFIQVVTFWAKHRRFEMLHIITMIMVLLLGSATLFLHNALFIKWKPTAIYWVFAFSFLLSQFIGERSLTQRLMDTKISLPESVWTRLNVSWACFFSIMGIANLYVVYNFNTDTWVNFKLFGTMGLTLIFVIAQALYMSKYIEEKNESTTH